MKVLIDISERDYYLACKYPNALIATYAHYIKDGTVLPKGHGRLIDADKLNTRPNHGNNSTRTMWYNIEDMVNKAPTVLEADV